MKSLLTNIVMLSVALFAWSETPCVAQSLYRKPSVRIEPYVKVRSETVRVKDIAAIRLGEKEFTPLVEIIKDVELTTAPAPSTKTVILGARVLELIQKAGVPGDSFGYSIPKAIVVEREGRIVAKDEVMDAMKTTIWSDPTLNIQPRSVEWANDQVIPVGATKIEAVNLGTPVAGKLPLRVDVTVDDKPAARFLATALVDDWREVPVPTRQLERGMLVAPEDVQLVRLNLLQQPADIISNINDMIGKRAKARIVPGETVRRAMLDIPPVISKGSKVNVVYKRGALSATLVGIAVDDGFEGGKIRIRNEASKKVIDAKVIDAETAEVSNS